MQIPKAIRSRFRFAGDLARAAEVARVLAKYGLATWMTEIDWAPFHSALKSGGGEVLTDQSFAVRVRLAFTDLGATFIKLGQVLSTRPNLVGVEVAEELSRLQQNTPPDAPDVVRRTVEMELGRPIDEIFSHFDDTALASASIGQVHQARLKSGRAAIVKVQHAGIEGTIRRDLDILGFLAELAERSEGLRAYQPAAVVREFSRTILNELDFRRELRNLQLFRRNFAEDETVIFPKPYAELSSGRVLTMGRLRGYRLGNVKALEKHEIDRPQLAKNGANVFINMIFRDGFYHADPHPGNFMVLPTGKIGLLDAGMVGRIDESLRKQVVDILMSASERDAQRLTDAVLRVCGTPAELDRAALSSDLTELFEQFSVEAVGQFDVSGALTGITAILHRHKLFLPGNLSMLIKCLILLEGTGRMLNPQFNLAELLEPWRMKYIKERLSPWTRLKEIARLYTDWERLAETAPRSVFKLLEKVEKGSFSIHLEHQHLKSAVNRMVGGFFISALLLASAVLISHDIPPLIHGLSIFGIVGYAVAVVFGFRMLWVNRDKRVSRKMGDWE